MPRTHGYSFGVSSTNKGRYRLSDMEIDFVSLVPAGDDPMAQVVISKAAPDKSAGGASGSSTLPNNDPSEGNMGTINKSDLDPEVVEYIDTLEAEVDDLSDKVTKAETRATDAEAEVTELRDTLSKSAPKDDESAEEISKALLAKADPAVRALIEKQQADLKAVQEVAKAERDARLTREYISKAEEMPMLNDSKEDLAGLLRRAADALTPEDNENLTKMLKAANEQIAQGNLFKSFGTGGADTTVTKSVRAKAEELRKSDPTLTLEQAEAKVYEMEPDLAWAAHRGEGN